jgi:hypothetical protein
MAACELRFIKERLSILSWVVTIAVIFLCGTVDSFAAGV